MCENHWCRKLVSPIYSNLTQLDGLNTTYLSINVIGIFSAAKNHTWLQLWYQTMASYDAYPCNILYFNQTEGAPA